MNVVCLDLEGVLVPEIWIAFAECGYGRTFLDNWIEDFKAAYPDENWEFEVEGDPDITGEIQTRLSENNEVLSFKLFRFDFNFLAVFIASV